MATAHEEQPTQKTRPQGKDKKGRRHKPVAPTLTEALGTLRRWWTASSPAVVVLAEPRGRTHTTSRRSPSAAAANRRWNGVSGRSTSSQNATKPSTVGGYRAATPLRIEPTSAEGPRGLGSYLMRSAVVLAAVLFVLAVEGCARSVDTSTTCADLDGDYQAMGDFMAEPGTFESRPDVTKEEVAADAAAYAKALCENVRNKDFVVYDGVRQCMTLEAGPELPCDKVKLPPRRP